MPIAGNDFYHMPDGSKLIRVTSVIEYGVPRPALVDWAAREVARCAMEWLTRLARARTDHEREAVLAWLKEAAKRQRDAAAKLGNVVHDLAEARALDHPLPLPTVEQLPFFEAFHRFCQRWRPRWEAAEMVVANYTDGWCGTCDAWAWLALPDMGPTPVLVILDYKSGRNVHPEVALQLSAYNRAEIGYLRDGTQVVPPRAEHAVVVHIRPGKYAGGYAVKRVDIGEGTYAAFLNAHRTAVQWAASRSRRVLARAYREPSEPTPAREVA